MGRTRPAAMGPIFRGLQRLLEVLDDWGDRDEDEEPRTRTLKNG